MPKTTKYKEDLIPRIRDLIDGYSSASILKEYLQNADDSGATELVITFDKQNYSDLKNTKYETAMGSSLLLYNNSIFEEKDFNSIVKISAQGKSSDATTTGRFGQGFNSSFSISDRPTFLSSDRAYWFDIINTAVSEDKEDDILFWENDEFNEIKNWLKTFEVAGFDGALPYNGTIFRLPLREENNNSIISREVFTFDDFLKWVEEWKNKSENLLFLRNLHTLILQEIDEQGNKIVHLEIKTQNSDEIQNINSSIQRDFKGNSLIDICNNWKESKSQLPLFKYHHNFSISYFNIEENRVEKRDETWAVVNGLFSGDNNCLIDKAIDVLKITPNPRKVLPWAGVALCLDINDKPIKKDSQWFTFLPLPIESPYDIQLHGWFDLNPKRTEITHDGTGEDKETLISWNQQLLEHGVGVAWALLIDYIKDTSHLNSYYDFWAKTPSSEFDKYLIRGFYKKISKLKCFYVLYKDKKTWMYPTDNILFFENREDTLLSYAFREHFKIINPKPKDILINNFQSIVDIHLEEIRPLFIRNYLEKISKDITFPILLTDISISMLSNKSWFLEVVKYCADRGYNYNLVRNLPLELTLDAKIYKVGANTLIDENPNLKFFQDMKYLFLDVELANLIKNSNILPSTWLQPTLKNKLIVLQEHWDKLDLNKEWLIELVKNIINDSDELTEALNKIKELKIVYQQNKKFTNLDTHISNFPPIIIRDEDKSSIEYFEKIGMNIIHIDYMNIYKPLVKWTSRYTGEQTFILKFSSEILVKHLLLLNNFDFFEDKDTRDFLLDTLASNTNWFNNLSSYYYNDEKERFLSIPLVKTVSNRLYSVNSSKKLFLPTGFNSPSNIKGLEGEYELVDTITDSKLFKMYKKMGIEEQTAENYIQEIIIPFLENSDSHSEKREVLKWLSKEIENITKDANNNIIDSLKNSKIIPSQLNENLLNYAFNFYNHSIELPPILMNKKYIPISFEDDEVQKLWINFLEKLDISNSILPQHITERVEQITFDNNRNDAISLLNYILDNFELFEKMNILDALKEYAWYPVEKPNDILKPTEKYTPLKKAKELILFDDFKIVGGYYHVLDRRVKINKEYAEKIGVITNIPNNHFFESFRKLMKLSPSDEKVLNYAKEVYKYIGKEFKGKTINFDIEEKAILIDNQWIAPKYVYQDKIELTGIYNWNDLIEDNKKSNLAKGLILLGVKKEPTFNFFIEQLKKLPQEQDLNLAQLKDANFLLIEIQNRYEYEEYLPLLTENNHLVLSSKIFINDLPAYKNAYDRNQSLYFCQVQFEELAKKLNISSLSENYTSELYDYTHAVNSNHKIRNILEKAFFKEGILRLLYHEKKIENNKINEDILNSILPSSLTFVSKLIVEYSIEDNFLFRSEESAYQENEELYILEQDDDDDMIEIIAKYICDTKNLSRDSFGWIERILRKQMNKEEIHIFLDRKKVMELTQKFNIEDKIIIVDNSDNIAIVREKEDSFLENSELKDEIVSSEPVIKKTSIVRNFLSIFSKR